MALGARKPLCETLDRSSDAVAISGRIIDFSGRIVDSGAGFVTEAQQVEVLIGQKALEGAHREVPGDPIAPPPGLVPEPIVGCVTADFEPRVVEKPAGIGVGEPGEVRSIVDPPGVPRPPPVQPELREGRPEPDVGQADDALAGGVENPPNVSHRTPRVGQVLEQVRAHDQVEVPVGKLGQHFYRVAFENHVEPGPRSIGQVRVSLDAVNLDASFSESRPERAVGASDVERPGDSVRNQGSHVGTVSRIGGQPPCLRISHRGIGVELEGTG